MKRTGTPKEIVAGYFEDAFGAGYRGMWLKDAVQNAVEMWHNNDEDIVAEIDSEYEIWRR